MTAAPTQRVYTRARAAVRPRRLAGGLAVVLVLAAWWMLLRPESLGGTTTLVTVTGSSMEPGMRTGDLAVVRRGGDHAVGDVVAFRVPTQDGARGGVVIHRIVGGDPATGFVLRGDNNDWDDPWRPVTGAIAGEMVLLVPGAGRVVTALADPVLAASLCAGLTVFLVLAGGVRRPEGTDSETGEPADTAAAVTR